MLDANVQKIVDAGFTEEQAENALKVTRYNADKALKNLQRGSGENKKDRPAKQAGETGKGRKGRNKDANDEDGVSSLKPTGKLSLFDFLEDKLPITSEPEKPAKSTESMAHKEEHNKYDKSNNERKGPNKIGAGRGGRSSTSRQPPQQTNHNNKYDNMAQNHSYWQNENQRNYNYPREDRPQYSYNSQQIQNEKPPRFQRKQEGEAKKQQNINMGHESSYPPNYQQQQQQQQQQMQSNYYTDRRNMPDNRNLRGYYNQQTMDSLANATAGMNIDTQQQQNRFNNYRQNTIPNYQNNYSYPTKPNYNNPTFQNDAYKRNNQYQNNNKNQIPNISNGQAMNQSFYNQYGENQIKNNQTNSDQQPDILDVLQQQNNQSHDQRNNFNYRGNGFYQASNIVGFQNATINEQARKMLAEGSEINWSIGDRCLAKYWEDNSVSKFTYFSIKIKYYANFRNSHRNE